MVATGDDGAMVYSSNGVHWEALPVVTTNWLYRVRYLNGGLIVVGQGGFIYASSNGLDWQPRQSGVDHWLNDVSWVDGRYYIAGTQGTLLSSEDGVDWANEGIITPKSLYSLATDGSYLLTAGFEGVILRSPIVPNQTPIQFLEYSRAPTEGGDGFQGLFLFGGVVDQQFTLDRAEVLGSGNWIMGPGLEFPDSSGTLYYLETVPASGAPATEYYRATLLP
jgi:hypothetical protein